jgi:hypothetical protein
MGLVVATVALVAGQLFMGSASAAPAMTDAQTAQLQTRVAAYTATHPAAHRISANTLAIPGGTVTLAVPGSTTHSDLAISCGSGHLCIRDGYNDYYDYYYCGYYQFTGLGDGVFNNNQTSGTVAKFYNSDGSLRWTNTAKDTGTASWTPVYYIRPC